MIPRRRLLSAMTAAGGLTVALAGTACIGGPDDPAGSQDPGGSGDPGALAAKPYPDPKLLAGLIEAKTALIRAYDDRVRKDPKAEAALSAYAGRHRKHLAALKDRARVAGQKVAPDPSASPSGSQAGADLADLEQRAARTHRAQLRNVHDGRLAELIASMAACETLHADALKRAG